MNESKRLAKESARLIRLKKQLAKPNSAFTVFMLFALIILVHLLDTYTTDISGKVQSSYLNELLIKSRGFTETRALQYVSILTIISIPLSLLAPFYKALMDKLGRRLIFIINIMGMSIGLFVCSWAPTMEILMVGMALILFFIIHDMQMVYVYEVAPKKWRSTIYFTCKFIGIFGILVIPLMRGLFMNESGGGWRVLYFLPAVIGLAVFVLAILFLRESDIFLKDQIAYLSQPPAERKKDAKGRELRKTGIVQAVKVCVRDTQLRWLMVAAACVFTAVVGVSQNYEAFLSFDAHLSTEQITNVLFIQIIAMGLSQLVSGFIADLWGRKAASVIFSGVVVITLCMFVTSSLNGASPFLIGLLLGVLIGSFWNITDLNVMMIAESISTELRGSLVGAQALAVMAGGIVSVIANVILLNSASLGTVKLIIGIPGVVASAIIILLKTRETKNADLETAGKAEA
ncbi:hypothetical protein FACS189476_09940 [Spirochaetia bacterium]|nr:hypothetical protein FACS189476_09940 [Spirochaetia bacterium]